MSVGDIEYMGDYKEFPTKESALDWLDNYLSLDERNNLIRALEQEPKTGHCKDCKYFEYDHVSTVDGIPLILAHEICSRWGDGCKTKEDGYCFLFEPQESEE